MDILTICFVALIALLSIVIITIVATIIAKHRDELYMFHYYEKEMVDDASNLFVTVVIYIIGYSICKIVDVLVLQWCIFIAEIVFLIPPIFSFFSTSVRRTIVFPKDLYTYFLLVTNFINVFLPAWVTLMLFIDCIKK